MSNDQNEPAKKGPFIEEEASMSDLRRASEELKAKIAEAKARSDMPIDLRSGIQTGTRTPTTGISTFPTTMTRVGRLRQ